MSARARRSNSELWPSCARDTRLSKTFRELARRCWLAASPDRWDARSSEFSSHLTCCRPTLPGVSIYNQQSGEFEFRAGPIISQLVLADEVNRATPKTQSAMLEAMDERQVTVEGITHRLPSPFMVMATQNPVEYEGTFPLPEAQLDRFLLIIRLGYPTVEEELEIVDRQQSEHPIDTLRSVADADEIINLQRKIREIYVDDLVKQYIVNLVDATRTHPDIALGASPRASLALFRGGQASSLIRGRDYVLPDDVKELAVPMLSHRMIVSAGARMRGVGSEEIVEQILEETAVPGGGARAGAAG